MNDQQTRDLLKANGVSNPDSFTESQLSAFRSAVHGVKDPAIIKKKIKDWRKIMFDSKR